MYAGLSLIPWHNFHRHLLQRRGVWGGGHKALAAHDETAGEKGLFFFFFKFKSGVSGHGDKRWHTRAANAGGWTRRVGAGCTEAKLGKGFSKLLYVDICEHSVSTAKRFPGVSGSQCQSSGLGETKAHPQCPGQHNGNQDIHPVCKVS